MFVLNMEAFKPKYNVIFLYIIFIYQFKIKNEQIRIVGATAIIVEEWYALVLEEAECTNTVHLD